MLQYVKYLPEIQESIDKFLNREDDHIQKDNFELISTDGKALGFVIINDVKVLFKLEID